MKIIASILLVLSLLGCATVVVVDEPSVVPPPEEVVEPAGDGFPEGEEVRAPWGYYDHCIREPESVFCP